MTRLPSLRSTLISSNFFFFLFSSWREKDAFRDIPSVPWAKCLPACLTLASFLSPRPPLSRVF